MIFVFGSNEAGHHAGGAAKFAFESRGAVWGVGYGLRGDSFAIPTLSADFGPLPLSKIAMYVKSFILIHAKVMRHRTFQVTQIGCGIAGFLPEQIAPFFAGAPTNCQFDTAWMPWLGDDRAYWGTHA